MKRNATPPRAATPVAGNDPAVALQLDPDRTTLTAPSTVGRSSPLATHTPDGSKVPAIAASGKPAATTRLRPNTKPRMAYLLSYTVNIILHTIYRLFPFSLRLRRLPELDRIPLRIVKPCECADGMGLSIEVDGNTRSAQLFDHLVHIAHAKVDHPHLARVTKIIARIGKRTEHRLARLLFPNGFALIRRRGRNPKMLLVPFRQLFRIARAKKESADPRYFFHALLFCSAHYHPPPRGGNRAPRGVATRVSPSASRYFCILAAFVISGCNLDVTQTIDATSADRETISYQETFDDEAYSHTADLGAPAAFGLASAKSDGWTAAQTDVADKHVLTFTKSIAPNDAPAELTKLNADATVEASKGGGFLLGPTAFIGLPLVRAGANGPILRSVPALLRPSEFIPVTKKPDPAFQLANARVNAAAVNTVVTIAVVVRDPSGEYRLPLDFARAVTVPNNLRLYSGHLWKLSSILGSWQAVGDYGLFDYEHSAPPLCSAQPQYRKSRMFGAGVYAQGAQMPPDLMRNAYTLADEWLSAHPVQCTPASPS